LGIRGDAESVKTPLNFGGGPIARRSNDEVRVVVDAAADDED
jgi:hypothetical protein